MSLLNLSEGDYELVPLNLALCFKALMQFMSVVGNVSAFSTKLPSITFKRAIEHKHSSLKSDVVQHLR